MKHEISELYCVFRPYRLDPDFAGCSHCVDPADTDRLANSELRSLTLADLDSYSFNAITTWGDTKHFKHFLPRLFEIASTDYVHFLSSEVLFGKLAYGKWYEWPAIEQRAVKNFLDAFWQSAITSELASADDDSIDTALCAIGNACSTVSPFLEKWLASNSVAAPQQLAQFVFHNIHHILQHQRLANSFWDGRSKQAAEVLDWLRLPTTYENLYEHQSQLDSRLAASVAGLAGL